uniref:Uncharacterized protein n=1 Tax=Sinocyclocheilus rhinocerous TaxID=307959 RepID=A0A673KRZ2_9TELE
MTSRCSIRSQGTNTWKKGHIMTELLSTLLGGERELHILAKPNALDALSLASWKSSLSERLVSITERLPASRKSPVDFSSMPAISLEKTNKK